MFVLWNNIRSASISHIWITIFEVMFQTLLFIVEISKLLWISLGSEINQNLSRRLLQNAWNDRDRFFKCCLVFVFILLTPSTLFTWLAMPTTMNEKASSLYFVAPYNSASFLLLYINTNRTFEELFPKFSKFLRMMYSGREMTIPFFSNYVKLWIFKIASIYVYMLET